MFCAENVVKAIESVDFENLIAGRDYTFDGTVIDADGNAVSVVGDTFYITIRKHIPHSHDATTDSDLTAAVTADGAQGSVGPIASGAPGLAGIVSIPLLAAINILLDGMYLYEVTRFHDGSPTTIGWGLQEWKRRITCTVAPPEPAP